MKEAANETALAGLYRVHHGVLDFIRQLVQVLGKPAALTVARSRMSSASAASLRSFSTYDL
jgi:hypothetical protein